MKIAIAEAKAQFADLIRRAEAGEEVELTRYGKPVAMLVPPRPKKKKTIELWGCMKGQFKMSDDINDGDAEVAALFAASDIFPK
jgi:prevent-host-death family protein